MVLSLSFSILLHTCSKIIFLPKYYLIRFVFIQIRLNMISKGCLSLDIFSLYFPFSSYTTYTLLYNLFTKSVSSFLFYTFSEFFCFPLIVFQVSFRLFSVFFKLEKKYQSRNFLIGKSLGDCFDFTDLFRGKFTFECSYPRRLVADSIHTSI